MSKSKGKRIQQTGKRNQANIEPKITMMLSKEKDIKRRRLLRIEE